jgi:acyl carrier protein
MSPSPTTIENRLVPLLADACNVAKGSISRDTVLAELGLDSVVLVSILGSVQLDLGGERDDNQLLRALDAETVGDIVAVFCSP